MSLRVADYIAKYLSEQQGVKSIFLVSGGGMMHLLDAISRDESLSYICQHNEQACAIAAEAYARQSGGLGVCYATSGPGATNILTGLVGAWLDSVPVLYITGQAKSTQTIRHNKKEGLRQFGTFEVDIIPMVKSVTKYSVFIDDPATIKYHLEKACALALSGRPGPVLLDIPVDIQGALIDPGELEDFNENTELENNLNELDCKDVLDKLANAKRPLIVAGHGLRVANIEEDFFAMLDKFNIFVVITQLGKDMITFENPLFVGHPGMKGDRAGNFAVQSADVILFLGCSLHVLTTGYELDRFAPDAYKIQVDPDEAILQREQVGVNKKICADVAFFVKSLLNIDFKHFSAHEVWLSRCRKWKNDLAVQNEPHIKVEGKLNYYEFIDRVSDKCRGGETIIADAGSAFYVVGQAFRVKKGQRVIISGALGAMGYTLPAATGASIASPNTTVIAITGDGSLQTNIHELAVFKHNKLNVKLFVINNSGYVSIKNTQNNFFDGHLAGVNESTGVAFPDLSILAEAYGLPYHSASSIEELEAFIESNFYISGPAICEVFSNEDSLIIPTVTSERLADGSMASKSLEDMFPYMKKEELEAYLTFS